MKIFIANVPHRMDEAELKLLLTQFGQVGSVKLLTDKETGKRRGFGFVEMPVHDQASSAIAALNGMDIYGRKLSLSEAQEKKEGMRQELRHDKKTTRARLFITMIRKLMVTAGK